MSTHPATIEASRQADSTEPGLPSDAGFTLVEVLVALLLLTVSLLALATFFPAELRMEGQSRITRGGIQTAQRELEQIRQNILAPSGTFTDADGNSLDAPTSCPSSGCGNALNWNGMIDFTQPAAVGYSAQLTDGSDQKFDVRWNVSITASGYRKIILDSQPINPAPGAPVPAHLATLVSK